MSTSLKSQLAPYLTIMEEEITTDLSKLVPADKLRDEVRKVLLKEINSQTLTALGELSNNVTYGATTETLEKSEAKALRYIGYLQQLLTVRNNQRLLVAATEEI